MKLLCAFIFLVALPLFAENRPPLKTENFKTPKKNNQPQKFVLDTGPGYGMFSCFTMVLGALDKFDKKEHRGLWVDFGPQGLYFEQGRGSNWWEYYFEPIRLGNLKGPLHRATSREAHSAAYRGRDKLGRERAYHLIQKYISIKPSVLEEVDRFVSTHFKGAPVIGIHYRGTDKVTSGEALLTPYDHLIEAIQALIEENQITDFKLFVATDEMPFLDYLQYYFPGQVVFQEAHRSDDNKPIHLHPVAPYQIGREALIDALILSKTSYLIRTPSNLSLCSTFFNPHIPVKLL